MAFRLVEVARQQVEEGPEVTFVHIPNVSHKRTRPPSSREWKQLLPSLTSRNAKAFQFEHRLSIDSSLSWSKLLDCGVRLLTALDQKCNIQRDSIYPLVLITEGLGGLILLKALAAAHQQRHRFQYLLGSIIGLVLIGVPNIRGTSDDVLKRLETLLRPMSSKASGKSLNGDGASNPELSSDRSHHPSFDLPEGLMSGHETVKTSLANARLSFHKVIAVLVDEHIVRMEWPRHLERVLPIDAQLDVVLQVNKPSEFLFDLARHVSTTNSAAVEVVKQARAEREHRESLDAQNPYMPVRSMTLASSSSSSVPTSYSQQQYLNVVSADLDPSFEIVPTPYASIKRVNLPCFLMNLQTRNERFWARNEEMRSLENVLLPDGNNSASGSHSGLRAFVLHAMGGTGKTEIAIEFCFRYRNRYDAIFFLHADTQDKLTDELTKVADTLGLERSAQPDATRNAVLAWLANPVRYLKPCLPKNRSTSSFGDLDIGDTEYARWLIVFDNANDPEMLLRYCWPKSACGSVLVTSRDRRTRNTFYFGKIGRELEPLPISEAAAFLQMITDQSATDSKPVAKAIASRLGGLPLAIEQIGAYISLNNLSLHRFWSMYKQDEHFEKLIDLRLAESRGYAYSIADVFALETLSPSSLALLNIMSFLDSDCIQSHLLVDNLETVNTPAYPKTEIDFIGALDCLGQSSIISRGFDDINLRVHRLVQDVVQAQLRSKGQLKSCFEAVVNLLWTDFLKTTREGLDEVQQFDRWKMCEQLYPHIVKLGEFCRRYTGYKGLSKSHRKLADLLNEAGWYWLERGTPSTSFPLVELAEQICRESGEDHTEQPAQICGIMTWISARNKQFDTALRYAVEGLELEQSMFNTSGKVTANLASAFSNLGAAYSMNKLPSRAFGLLDESQKLIESMPDFKPEHNFSLHYERGLVHQQQGEHSEAAECLLSALRDRVAAFGENDRLFSKTGQLYYALGNTRNAQAMQKSDSNLLDESMMWHTKALEHFRATAGDRHYKTACALFRMAEHYIRMKEYGAAHIALSNAVKIFQLNSYCQQELSRSLFLYSKLWRLEGINDRAQTMLKQSLELFNNFSPERKRTMDSLAEVDFEGLCGHGF